MAKLELQHLRPKENTLASLLERTFGFGQRSDRPNIIPVRGKGGEWIAPNWLYEAAKAATLPSHVLSGGQFNEGDVYDMAMAVGAGSLAGSAPSGALRSGLGRPQNTRVFHASPHEFDRFNLSDRTVGTGEGSAMVGRGLYFAEEENVAKFYRELFERRGQRGHMYEAEIKADPESFIDLNKPLREQPDVVKDQLRSVAEFMKKDPETVTTNQIGAFLQHPKIMERLKKGGISGIRYRDQYSRERGSNTWNYVVWDDDLVDIVRKYGWAGVIGGGALAAEGID